MISGPLVLALLVAQDADHEIGVGHIAATAKCAEHVPATCQERQGIRRLSLLSAYLGEKECRLGLTVMIAEPPAELKDLFEAGCSVGYSALPPVGARESGQAVCLPRGIPQLSEDDVAVREVPHRLRQAVLAAAQIAQAAQQRCLGKQVARQPGSAKSYLMRALPLVPAGVHLEEVGEQPGELLPEPSQALAPYLVQAHRQARVLGCQPLV